MIRAPIRLKYAVVATSSMMVSMVLAAVEAAR